MNIGAGRLLLLALIGFALLQNRHTLSNFFFPPAALPDGEVILLATRWCGYCAQTRTLLAELGINYRELDIETSEEGRTMFADVNGRGVPVLRVGAEVVHGWNEARMRTLLMAATPTSRSSAARETNQ